MYVVRRAFRNFGKMITPGSIVEPGNIKRFRFRLSNSNVVEVNEHNFDKWREYFKVRFGVDIAATGGTLPSVDLTGEAPAEAPAEATTATKDVKPVKPVEAVKVVKVVTPK